ncbi:protein 5NUC [Copidosoma floridanum]|uniref:protein 5NUC n=1 Tax=Copidosoma floridanum TaxID=29053 RepID=UPI0006C9886E|nr:protein 5NUC [Copidosoma floridanum]
MGAKSRRGQVWLVLATIAIWVSEAAPADDKLTVRIIHTNDMHARFEEISKRNTICSEAEKKHLSCYGGFARMATLIRQMRDEAPKYLPTFFLNAGDTYLGSRLFTLYKWKIVARFLNILKPDVASLGNHEFDQGPDGLVPFLQNASFPIVAANLDFSGEPDLRAAKQLMKSFVLTARGRQIGVIGYLTPDTMTLSQPRNVKFLDEVPAIREEAQRLKAQGCRIIIALGHSGFEADKRIGREVEDVDLVIGGHTNTFLYNGPQPDIEVPEGPYPYVVTQPSGRKVYVAQAFAYTKYLGNLEMDFDADGEITRIEGQPVLVNASIPKAKDVEEEVSRWAEAVKNWTTEEVGKTKVLINGNEKSCRLYECNFGNLVTDAMIYWNTKLYDGEIGWTDAPIAIYQAGGIRTSIVATNENKVSKDDVVTALPYGSRVLKVYVKAETLMEALEWSVHDRISQNETGHGGCFLQYSGIQVTYDISKPQGSRVVSAKVRCAKCTVPTYLDLKKNATYTVLMPDFLHNGGDGFQMLRNTTYKNLNVTTAEILSDYVNHTSPVYPGVEGRIKFVLTSASDAQTPQQNCSSSASDITGFHRLSFFAKLSCFTLAFLLLAVV